MSFAGVFVSGREDREGALAIRAIRFSKILSDFCSRGLKHLLLHLKRPGRNIRSQT